MQISMSIRRRLTCGIAVLIVLSVFHIPNHASPNHPSSNAAPGRTPFVGQVILVPYEFVPRGWMACDGQLLNPDEYPQLYALLEDRFGGNNMTTFALPDLRERCPVNVSNRLKLGQRGPNVSVTADANSAVKTPGYLGMRYVICTDGNGWYPPLD